MCVEKEEEHFGRTDSNGKVKRDSLVEAEVERQQDCSSVKHQMPLRGGWDSHGVSAAWQCD